MRTFDNLYARDSKGNINTWSILIAGTSTGAKISIEEGLLDGKQTQTNKDVMKGKNLGKMNATTPYEQAESEAQSRWEKKKKQGYKSLEDLGIDSVDDLEEALPMDRTDANGISKPMKAQPYYKVTSQTIGGKVVKTKTNIPVIKFPCLGQPKLNGFRVMARWEETIQDKGTLLETVTEGVVFRSKEGLRYIVCEHIEAEFTKTMFLNCDTQKYDLAFDGEMYIHGEILSEIASAVKKRNPKTILLKFYIFDLAIENVKQQERLQRLKDIIEYEEGSRDLNNIIRVKHWIIKNNEEAQELTDKWITEKYEGGIFRCPKAYYAFGKRPQTMTKLKRSEDKEFIIVDVKGGDNTPDLAVFVCVQEEGLQFDCTPEGSEEVKREYLANKHKYIGKMLTIRFFERTKDNKPFHAIGVTVRDYE